MGRGAIRRRKPARHLSKVEGIPGPQAFEHSPYTYEGAIEAMGQFARGTSRMSAAQARVVRRLFVAMIAALVVIGAAAWLVGRIG